MINKIIQTGVFLIVGSSIANKFGYKLSIQNAKTPFQRFMVFIQYPFQYLGERK